MQGANGTSIARLRRRARILQAAAGHELRRHVRHRDQLHRAHLFVLHRGPMPLMEFDPDGNFVRGWGDGLFDRPHGLRIDARRQHLGDRRRVARRLQVQSVGPARDGARRARAGPARCTTSAICGCSTSRARRWSGRPATSTCCRATARAPSLHHQVRHATAISSRPGARTARGRASSTFRIRWCSTPRGCSTSPTAATRASRCSTPTATTSASGASPARRADCS